MWDVIGMFMLSFLGIYLEFQAPFERYLVPEFLPRYSYPFVANSVPTWQVMGPSILFTPPHVRFDAPPLVCFHSRSPPGKKNTYAYFTGIC